MIRWRGGGPDRALALKHYQQSAARYDRSARRVAAKRARAIELLRVTEGETVLDVASGTGPALPLLSARVGRSGRVIGIEQSPEMMALARERVARSRLANVELIEAPVEEARIAGPVDAILFSYTHDVLRSPAALANIFHAARPGARVVSLGVKLFSGWLAFLNPWVKRRTWGYLSTVEGLDRPWIPLEPYCSDWRLRETFFLGSGYIGSGTYLAAK